jgi:oligoribonuclease NrnB/cAMP/cGMP phosphodiesterase (DHH superfamily)
MKDTVILYHKDCLDGFTSAWVAWKKYKNKATYIPVEHNSSPPEELVGKKLFFIDFCYPKDTMDTLAKKNVSITIIDHHISAKNTIQSFNDHIYSESHSGCVLAWNYFFPGKKIPRLLRHVEDIDLWKFTVPYTKEITAVLETEPFSFNRWSILVRDMENADRRKKYITKGKAILGYQDHVVSKIVGKSEDVSFEGHRAKAVNTPILTSKVGNALVQDDASVSIMWSKKDGKVVVSLRSDGTVDVSKLAQKYGGGGHIAAAAFAIPEGKPFPWKKIT